ncbi:MAG: hypothetical protein ACSLE0_05635 [Chitinophagaceae bacterium]
MKRFFLLIIFSGVFYAGISQELYVFSEPASNMPAKSISVKLGAMYGKGVHSGRILQRYMPEVMFGLNKSWMIHTSFTFSDMHEPAFNFESARMYAKWRFLSFDEIHRHFRMAAYGAATYSRNHLDHNEINLMGDQSGVQAGIIATQLWNKLALSGSASLNEVLDKERRMKVFPQQHVYRSLNYSLSAGYLVLPLEYTSYKQTNINIYLEMLGSRNLDWQGGKYYADLAPAIQLIFNSNGKLNLGYRFQVAGDIYRLMDKSFYVSYEHTFFNALKKKK